MASDDLGQLKLRVLALWINFVEVVVAGGGERILHIDLAIPTDRAFR